MFLSERQYDGELYAISFFEGTIAHLATNSVLPVKLLTLAARVEESGAWLSWKTAEETDFSHFKVERSLNRKSWETAGIVQAGGGPDYHFHDNSPVKETRYYRLKMADRDRRNSYSHSVQLNVVSKGSAFTNRVTGMGTIPGEWDAGGIVLSDLAGRSILLSAVKLRERMLIDPGAVSPGVYRL